MPRILQHLFCAGAMLMVSASWADCRYAEVTALPLRIQPDDGAPVIDVRVDNEVVPMLADTGYHNTVLTKTETDRQQLPLIHSKTPGRPDVLTARPDELVIGSMHARKAYLTVIDYAPMKAYSGIVGGDYLLQADLEIALADKMMRIFKADDCYGKSLAYWDPQAQETWLEQPRGFSSALVDVKLNGRSTLAIVDTGAPYSMVSQNFARLVDVSAESPDAVRVADYVKRNGDTALMWNIPFDSFSIGGETIAQPRLAVTELALRVHNTRVPGMVLGRDFLSTHRVLLAFGQKRMYFSYLGGQVFKPPE